MESLVLFLPFLLIMGGFMYFASRRQRRAMQATIVAITDDTVDLEIAPGVVTTWMKLAIRDRILPDDDEAADDLEESEGLTDPGR